MTVLHTEQLVPASYMAAAPPKLQLYANNAGVIGSSVGSPISGVVTSELSVWTFDVTSVAVGNYFAQIEDVSDPAAAPYQVRKTSTAFYESESNDAIEPNPIIGLCNLLVATTTAGARVWAKLAEQNNTVDDVLVDDQVLETTTDEDGNATLVLIQYGQFTAGGSYRIRVANGRDIATNVLVRMPNAGSANIADLVPL